MRLEQLRRDFDGLRARLRIDVERLGQHVVDEHLQRVSLSLEAAFGRPAAYRQRGGTGRLVGRPAIADAMGQEPIDDFLRLRQLRRDSVRAPTPRARATRPAIGTRPTNTRPPCRAKERCRDFAWPARPTTRRPSVCDPFRSRPAPDGPTPRPRVAAARGAGGWPGRSRLGPLVDSACNRIALLS